MVATDAPLNHAGLVAVADAAHHGPARAVAPVHGPSDGDAIFAAGTADGPVPVCGDAVTRSR